MDEPELSIAITCYNLGRFLRRAIDSCLPLLEAVRCELLIVDDASTDETPSVCRAAQEQLHPHVARVSVLRHATNQGLVASCNEALELGTGPKWLRLDADDELVGQAMTQAFRLLENRRYDVGLTDYETIDPSGDGVRRESPELRNPFTMNACGVLFERSALRRLGGYRQLFWEEHDLMLRLLQNGAECSYQPLVTYRYHKHAANMTSDETACLAGWRELIGVWGHDALRGYPQVDPILKKLEAAHLS